MSMRSRENQLEAFITACRGDWYRLAPMIKARISAKRSEAQKGRLVSINGDSYVSLDDSYSMNRRQLWLNT